MDRPAFDPDIFRSSARRFGPLRPPRPRRIAALSRILAGRLGLAHRSPSSPTPPPESSSLL